MEAALLAKLLGNPALAALVNEISWVERGNDDLPVITLTLIDRGREYHLTGHDGLDASWVQADVWAGSVLTAFEIARAFTSAIEPQEDIDGWRIGPCFLEIEHNMPPEDLDGGGKVHRVMMEWRVFNAQLS